MVNSVPVVPSSVPVVSIWLRIGDERIVRGVNGVELVYGDATMKQGFVKNVHLVAWYDAPTADQMREYGRCARMLHQRYPGASALVNMVVSGTPRFSTEVRDLARLYTKEGLHAVGTAHVVLVSGLLGSAVRGFLGTTVLLGQPPNPTKVFGAMDEASRWLAEHLASRSAEPWDAGLLARIAEQFVESR